MKYRPTVVLGALRFRGCGRRPVHSELPFGQTLRGAGGRINGIFGVPALWQDAGWRGRPLGELIEWMITRHDVWLGSDPMPLLAGMEKPGISIARTGADNVKRKDPELGNRYGETLRRDRSSGLSIAFATAAGVPRTTPSSWPTRW